MYNYNDLDSDAYELLKENHERVVLEVQDLRDMEASFFGENSKISLEVYDEVLEKLRAI